MLSFHKLRIFLAVAERGSFNRAASDLMMSQSGVSQHMRDLEASLGADLFIRSPQGVVKTEAGELLYAYGQQILKLVTEVEQEIMQAGQLHTHRLELGTTPGVSVYILPQWLRAFQDRYSSLQVSLDAVKTGQVVDGVLSGRYDLGFLEGELDELDRAELGRLDVRQLAYQVMVGADHPWRQRQTVSLNELARQPFINRQPGSRTRQWLERVLADRGTRLNNAAELDSPGTVKYALLNGMGVGILPDYAVVGEVQRGEIHVLQLENLTLQRPLKLVWNRRKSLDSVQRAFLGVIEASTPALAALIN
ncbi:MAG: LysR family transcriptional regulator [Chloroflexota bacterium]